MDTAGAKLPGKVRGQCPAPFQNGAGGIVECPPRVLVLLLPAGGAQHTFGAHLVRRTGKNFRWILRIGALGMEGLLDRIIQGMEGRGHLPHFTGNCLPAALQVRSPPCPRGGWKGLFLLRADGQHQEDNGPHHRLHGQAHMESPVPAPQHRHKAGQHVDQRGHDLSGSLTQPAGQARQGKNHTVIGLFSRGQVQGHPGTGPGQNPFPHALAGRQHHPHRRQEAAHGEGPQNFHPGQGHEHRARQHHQTDTLPWR